MMLHCPRREVVAREHMERLAPKQNIERLFAGRTAPHRWVRTTRLSRRRCSRSPVEQPGVGGAGPNAIGVGRSRELQRRRHRSAWGRP